MAKEHKFGDKEQNGMETSTKASLLMDPERDGESISIAMEINMMVIGKMVTRMKMELTTF